MPASTATRQPYGNTYGGTATENYERFFVPAIGGPLAEDLVRKAGLDIGERVLDVGCGTGVVARLAAQRVGATGTVAGLDVNAGMLAVARSVAASADVPVQWYETAAEHMPLPDESFDVALCQLALQFMDDKAAALREMRRVLVPNGRLLVDVPTPTPFWDVMETSMERHIPSAAAFVRLVFSLNDPAGIEQLLRDAGFRHLSVRRDTKKLRLPGPADFLWQYVHSTPLSAAIAEAGRSVLQALEADVVRGWQPWVDGDGMTYGQAMIHAYARR